MEIKVLGTGCAKCARLYEAVEQAVMQAGVDATIQKVEDITEIMAHGVMMTPALVLDGTILCMGKVPRVGDIVEWLTRASSTN